MRAGAGSSSIGHDVDRRGASGDDGFEIEQQQRAQDARIAHRRRQLQHARMRRAIGQPQIEADRRRAAVGALERRRQRLEQPREHERQRLERVDRPLELEAADVARRLAVGHERARIEPAREALQRHRRGARAATTTPPPAAPRDRRASRCPTARRFRTAARDRDDSSPGGSVSSGDSKPTGRSRQTARRRSRSDPGELRRGRVRAIASRAAAPSSASARAPRWPRRPASNSARASAAAIAGGSPISRPSPDTSSSTSPSLAAITRGEKSRAIAKKSLLPRLRAGRSRLTVRGSQFAVRSWQFAVSCKHASKQEFRRSAVLLSNLMSPGLLICLFRSSRRNSAS